MPDGSATVSGEQTAVEAVLLERVGTLEDRYDSLEKRLEDRRDSNEGFRRETLTAMNALREMLVQMDVRMRMLEDKRSANAAKGWQVLAGGINIIIGAVIGVLMAKLSK